ncbi:MAG: hypothetical protein Q9227_006517 [Pyrenula ochraceoflavens]
MAIKHITSTKHFQTVLDSNTYVVADFYADWCGPCKAIAPLFEQLARSESKSGKLVFVKIDVDSQQEISRSNSVTAMPTFLIFKNGRVANTLRGADPNGLRSAVMKASSDAAVGPARESPAFTSKGHVLGSENARSRPSTTSSGPGMALPANMQGLVDNVINFLGLYFVSLFSLDPYAAAESSRFNLTGVRRR